MNLTVITQAQLDAIFMADPNMKDRSMSETSNSLKNWTVVLHFGRGKSETRIGLTMEEAKQLINIAVFSNRDCINFSCYRVND